MSGVRRTQDGGLIDRSKTIAFRFDGRELMAHPGDTLASALLANEVSLVARSFKYHRPRGIMAAGVEEPSALVTVGHGGRTEPNTRATDVFVYEGLEARSQNAWPSLQRDIGAVNGLLSRLIPAGFYYKTFFGPPKRWMRYEHFIRKAAGLGPAPQHADPDAFLHRAAFCDLLVVGAGRSGLAAALTATEAGKRVMLVEQDALAGGVLLREAAPIDGTAGAEWAADAVHRIRAAGGRVLFRSTAIGYWDGDLLTVAERLAEPGQAPGASGAIQRYWKVRAGQVVLATGAIERPLAFAGNDRPGVMLAQAVRTYIHRFGVLPGRRVVIATNDDDAYRTAEAVAAAGGDVVAILDARPDCSDVASAAKARFPVHAGAVPFATRGRAGVRSVEAEIRRERVTFRADLLAVSGGFTPVVHLHSQAGGKLEWREDIQAFVPGTARQAVASVGAAAGDVPPISTATACLSDPKTSFVDFQNDVTLADIDLAWAEGYRSVEHLKRYTTLGMGTDQGKTGNMAALARLAAAQDVAVPDAGLTTFRPPYTPVTLGALAGPNVRAHAAPRRRLALHAAHQALGAAWQPVGYWERPRAYPGQHEPLAAAALREARMVRTTVGMTDVSTLAKFEIAGPDAAALLERVCATPVARLAEGRGRYTVMLREDGMVMDDGTVWRIGANRFLLTSSTGGAERMAAHISYVRNILCPALRVSVVNVQEHYAALAVAGPRAAAVVGEVTGAVPPRHMSCARVRIAGVSAVLLAASYSGERAFEVHASADAIETVWAVLAAGAMAHGGGAYGLDAMDHLRVEKGHVVIGVEADGRVTPADIGLGRMIRKNDGGSGGFVGAQALLRPALARQEGRRHLVGLEANGPLPEGAMLIPADGGEPEGHITTASPRISGEGAIGLALLRDGAMRMGEEIIAASPTRGLRVRARVVPPIFYDPEGARYRD